MLIIDCFDVVVLARLLFVDCFLWRSVSQLPACDLECNETEYLQSVWTCFGAVCVEPVYTNCECMIRPQVLGDLCVELVYTNCECMIRPQVLGDLCVELVYTNCELSLIHI